jgi:hypothetical protein
MRIDVVDIHWGESRIGYGGCQSRCHNVALNITLAHAQCLTSRCVAQNFSVDMGASI